jgi:four helix bundle protein
MTQPYERFDAWKACHQLALAVYRITKTFPREEKYGLAAQARSAAYSAAANIAEGSARRGRAEFRRFLDFSVGSLTELAYAFRLCLDLELIPLDAWREIEAKRELAAKLTWKLHLAMAPKRRPG